MRTGRLVLLLAAVWLLPRTAPSQTRPIVIPRTDTASRPNSKSAEPEARTAEEISGLKTSVEFQIVSGSPSAALEGHRWVEALKEHGVTVRIRTPRAGDELGVSENIQGTLRWVVATGQLDSRGRLKFPDRTFKLRQSTQIKEWIDELKLYGAQGAPEGKPLWGLTYEQFDKVFQSLSVPVANPVADLPLKEALKKLQLPAGLPVRYHSTATAHLEKLPAQRPARVRVEGLAGGTALAAVLANYRLGYRPLRTPAGTMELVIEPLENLKEPWPIGWEPDKGTSQGKLAPGLFKFVQVGFDEIPLEKILAAISEAGEIPVVINHDSAARRGIDLQQPVSYPRKRAAYMMVLDRAIRGTRLKEEFRVDERGVPFIYVTAFVPRTIKDLSPAESN